MNLFNLHPEKRVLCLLVGHNSFFKENVLMQERDDDDDGGGIRDEIDGF